MQLMFMDKMNSNSSYFQQLRSEEKNLDIKAFIKPFILTEVGNHIFQHVVLNLQMKNLINLVLYLTNERSRKLPARKECKLISFNQKFPVPVI